MLKRKCYKKILVTSTVLFSLLLIYLIPSKNENFESTQILEYVDSSINTSPIYLLDSYNMLAKTNVIVSSSKDIVIKAKDLLSILIKDGEGENNIPSGFKSLIPSDTNIISIDYKDNVLKVNFSKELLNVEKENEEKIIEAIIYTLTEIEEVQKIIIYVEDEILTKLPKSKKNLPSTLDRSYGINKDYSINTYKDINSVNIYYINKYNNDYYYVPVTKYVNDSREKIKIIVEELSSSTINDSNLMSFLNSNTKLLATQEEIDTLYLVFNEFIFSDIDTRNILEEVIYSISLSVKDSYDYKELVFKSGDEEIYKTVLKTID